MLLDESANVILLEESYENLFAENINRNLPEYLTLYTDFLDGGSADWTFDFWIYYVTRLGTKVSRTTIHVIYFFGLAGIFLILFKFIPSTPFMYLNTFLTLMWSVSVYAGLKLINMITDWQPLIIHFPIALISTSVAFECLHFILKEMIFALVGGQCFWLILVWAVASGIIDDSLIGHFARLAFLANHGAMQILTLHFLVLSFMLQI